jgi:endoglucanase
VKYLTLCLLLIALVACSTGQPETGNRTNGEGPVEPLPSPTPRTAVEEVEAPAEPPIDETPEPAQEDRRVRPTLDPNLDPAFAMNARIGRGVNLGNALEAPREGAWGVTIKQDFFPIIKQKGFDSIRVPIKWSTRAKNTAPYTIEPVFFERIDWVIEQALANDLVVIINIHHFDEVNSDPQGQREFLLGLWAQIAERYKDMPETVIFELLNEPHGSRMSASVWNKLAAETLAVVRETNPDRFVIIGPVNWNNVDELANLRLPEEDRRIIGTFHYYNPFHFTHQGAEWNEGSDRWLGTTWDATESEKSAVRRDFDKAVRWSQQYHRPIYMGEFGAYRKADIDSRARWTEYVSREAEARGFSWSYWEFSSGFGVYHSEIKMWVTPLIEALIPVE